jgi:xyloglucan-specific exo-beta-1,4-glucanase
MGRFLKGTTGARDERVNWKQVLMNAGGLIPHLEASSDGTLIIGTDVSGAYAYNTGSSTWTPMSIPLRATFTRYGGYAKMDGCRDVAVAWSDSNRMYWFFSVEGLGNQVRLYRSDDKGQTSYPTNYPQSVQTFLEGNGGGERLVSQLLAVDPIDPNIVYAANPGGYPLRTFDGGVTWSTVTGLPNTGTRFGMCCTQFDFTSAAIGGRTSIIYTCIDGVGVYRTQDAGETWSQISSTIVAPVRNSAMSAGGFYYISHGISATRYVSRYAHGSGVSSGVGGTNWTDVRSSANSTAIACHRTQSNIMAVQLTGGGQFQYTSNVDDATPSWSNHLLTAMTWNSDDAPWLEEIATRGPTANSMVFVGNDLWNTLGQGIWKTTNMVATGSGAPVWEGIVEGIEEWPTNDVIHEAGMDAIFIGGWDEGAMRRAKATLDVAPDATAKVHGSVTNAAGSYMRTWVIQVDPQNHDLVVYFSNPNTVGSAVTYGYGNAAGSFTAFSSFGSGLTPANSILQYNFGAVNDGVIIWIPARSTNQALYRSTDLGTNWAVVDNGGAWTPNSGANNGWSNTIAQTQRTIAADYVNPDKWYVMNYLSNKCWRSSDRGLTWTEGTAQTGFQATSGYPRTMKTVPGYENHVWVSSGPNSSSDLNFNFPGSGTSSSLNYSENGGDTWAQLDASNLKNVARFGFGKPRTTGEYPTIYVEAWYKGVYGIFRIDNRDITTIRRLICNDTPDKYPRHWQSEVRMIDGDKDIYGRCYVALSSTGVVYCDRL